MSGDETPSWRDVAEQAMYSTDDGDPTAEAQACALLEIADQMRVANLLTLAGRLKEGVAPLISVDGDSICLSKDVAQILGLHRGDAE